MRRLLADPVRRLEFAAASVDRARECYSWSRTADRLLTVYYQVTGIQRYADETVSAG
jgi:hypothetical protein